MKEYIVIKNDGLIEIEDLILIGSSTKRDATDKIGMFGSGWKYALAWFMRNRVDIKIYSGHNVIKIDRVTKKHRNNEIDVITVNDIETSLTTEMGPQWTAWMALREVVSNAIDEGGYSLDIETGDSERFMEKDKSTIVIESNDELEVIMKNFKYYFSFDEEPDFISDTGHKIYVKDKETPMNIYRKGIRCFDTNQVSFIDIDFKDIDINESRLTQDYDISSKFERIITDNKLTKDILRVILKTKWNKYGINFRSSKPTEHIIELAKQLKEDGESFTCQMESEYKGLLSGGGTLNIPNDWWGDFSKHKLVDKLFDFLPGGLTFVKNEDKAPDGIKYYLSGIGFNHDVQIGKFLNNTYKKAYFNEDVIYINEDNFVETDECYRKCAAYSVKELDVNTIETILK